MLPARIATAKMLTASILWRSEIRRLQPRPSPRSSFLAKAIPDPVERLDRSELPVDRSELAAHALDVAVDGAVVDVDVVLIGDVHQLVARFDDPWPLRQRLEDQEFGHGEGDLPAVPPHPVTGRIHGEAAAHDLGRLGRILAVAGPRPDLGPPQHGPDSGEEEALGEGLGDIVV